MECLGELRARKRNYDKYIWAQRILSLAAFSCLASLRFSSVFISSSTSALSFSILETNLKLVFSAFTLARDIIWPSPLLFTKCLTTCLTHCKRSSN